MSKTLNFPMSTVSGFRNTILRWLGSDTCSDASALLFSILVSFTKTDEVTVLPLGFVAGFTKATADDASTTAVWCGNRSE